MGGWVGWSGWVGMVEGVRCFWRDRGSELF